MEFSSVNFNNYWCLLSRTHITIMFVKWWFFWIHFSFYIYYLESSLITLWIQGYFSCGFNTLFHFYFEDYIVQILQVGVLGDGSETPLRAWPRYILNSILNILLACLPPMLPSCGRKYKCMFCTDLTWVSLDFPCVLFVCLSVLSYDTHSIYDWHHRGHRTNCSITTPPLLQHTLPDHLDFSSNYWFSLWSPGIWEFYIDAIMAQVFLEVVFFLSLNL